MVKLDLSKSLIQQIGRISNMSKEVRVISDFFLLCPVLFAYAACDKKT